MDEFKFSAKDFDAITTFEMYKKKSISSKKAAEELCCSERTFFRKYKKYVEKGAKSLLKVPRKKGSKFNAKCIVNLFKNEYLGFSIQHFKEKLDSEKNIKISYASLYRILKSDDVYSPYVQKKTIRNAKKAANSILKSDKNEKQPLQDFNIFIVEKPTNRIPKGDKAGFLIQMDASSATFFGDIKTHLHLAIDVCTGTFVGAILDYQETTKAYYIVLKQIFLNYGLPENILTDNRSCFVSTKCKKDTITSNGHVQIEYALRNLNIHLETTSLPTKKAIIERANGTFQRRLCAELHQKKIENLNDANEFIINKFLPEMNKLFGNKKCSENLYRPKLTEDDANLALSICFIRSFDKAGTISFEGEKYLPGIANSNGETKFIRTIKPKTQCMFIIALNDTKYISVDGTIFRAFKVNDMPLDYLNYASPNTYKLERSSFAENSKIIKEFNKQKYTPWRTDMYKLFLNKKSKQLNNIDKNTDKLNE